jgi:predicted O-methyltransferase YrrM
MTAPLKGLSDEIMDILETRKCNHWNLEAVARYLQIDGHVLTEYYDELLADQLFLRELNARMRSVRQRHGFLKGIFQRSEIDNADWFAFERVLLYVLLRHIRPNLALETGVFYGGNTVFMLAAMARNGIGTLVSIDLPDLKIRDQNVVERHPLVGDSELYDDSLRPGFIVPEYLRPHWHFVEGDSHRVIPQLQGPFDFFIHDSEHSFAFIKKEISIVRDKLSPGAVIVADDIDWSNGFFAFCLQERLHPLLLTDNGKDNLRVRIGLTKLDHPNNRVPEIIGGAA